MNTCDEKQSDHLVNALAEIEDVIRTMPPRDRLHHDSDEILIWLGRATAAVANWDGLKGVSFSSAVSNLHATGQRSYQNSISIIVLLHQARATLRLQTLGPVNIAIGQGLVFDYFEELRKPISLAKSDIIFIDPYLDADFVSRYLPSISSGVTIRLLGRERMKSLVPAACVFAEQSKAKVEVRSAKGFHDRIIIVDQQICFQSGASFKDGGRTSPTTISQIIDAFPAILQTYEQIWASAAPAEPK
jgi:hypothetical protein